MNSTKTLYKLMKVSSRDLEIPDVYQRKLNAGRVAKIVAGFDERIANEPTEDKAEAGQEEKPRQLGAIIFQWECILNDALPLFL